MEELEIYRFSEHVMYPTRKFPTDAGLDFYANGDHVILPNSYTIVKTGIIINLPPDTVMLLFPKSRSNWLVGAGVVDWTYEGEILVKVFNPTDKLVYIPNQSAVCQGVILNAHFPIVKAVESLEDLTDFGKGNRGATGGIVSQMKGQVL